MDPVSELEKKMSKTLAGLPRKVGSEVVNFALSNFSRQGFLGDSFHPWRPRKEVNKKNTGRAIGVLRGKLRRSVKIMEINEGIVAVGSFLPYAKAFNDGFRGTVTVRGYYRNVYHTTKAGRGTYSIKTRKERTMKIKNVVGVIPVKSHQRKMNQPARPFLGPSQYMEANIRRLIALEIMKTANS